MKRFAFLFFTLFAFTSTMAASHAGELTDMMEKKKIPLSCAMIEGWETFKSSRIDNPGNVLSGASPQLIIETSERGRYTSFLDISTGYTEIDQMENTVKIALVDYGKQIAAYLRKPETTNVNTSVTLSAAKERVTGTFSDLGMDKEIGEVITLVKSGKHSLYSIAAHFAHNLRLKHVNKALDQMKGLGDTVYVHFNRPGYESDGQQGRITFAACDISTGTPTVKYVDIALYDSGYASPDAHKAERH